jgi:arabinan endo-1,5-alpha-L-arabinosidase
MMRRWRVPLTALVLLLTLGAAGAAAAAYRNPVPITIPGGGQVESCADPAIIKGQQPGDRYWYLFCTTDALNDADRNATGALNLHFIPQARSLDLVNWTYVGDAFSEPPGWVGDNAGVWSPQPEYFNGQYYLYYSAPATEGGSSAIGVATSRSPTGPWTDSGGAVVERAAGGQWMFDPDVIEHKGERYIVFGSYYGGVKIRKLSADGFRTDRWSEKLIALDNRYEGSYLHRRRGYWYLFVSATDCCRGALTGYSVFVGRSTSPTGPFVDREGVSLLADRVGGTPVISMNGTRWVGTGHNAVITDYDGQDWFAYHAVDRNDPYFTRATGFTKRPLLLDRLTWVNGWPTVRGGHWASDTPQSGPAAQVGQRSAAPVQPLAPDRPGSLLPDRSDEFDGSVGARWSWVREPAVGTFGAADGWFRFDTPPGDLAGG